MSAPLILSKPMRRRHWGWTWRSGCVSVEVHEPVSLANKVMSGRSPNADAEAFSVRVFVYGEGILLAHESSAFRAAALVTRKLRQIHLCLTKVIGS